MRAFLQKLQDENLTLNRMKTDILQVNIGRRCNQACHHCHVESSPKRTENMDEKTVDRIIALMNASNDIHTLDITGGAPELNPYFKKLVLAAREKNLKIMDRCNLTILFEPDQEETAHFLKANQVHIVASLPCYSKENVEKQRGHDVFNKSIEALKLLNSLGYGKEGTDLMLDLVYNPVGAFLPPAQAKLESDYKRELKEFFDIEFNHLFTITNMPIKRFLNDLKKQNKLEEYMELLANNFNPHAAKGVMCRNLISISWNGEIFDCDFNQMLDLPMGTGQKNVWEISSFDEFYDKPITFANHCYACTAGAGSSCGGALI
ncbi:MAG: arsenosugar biosynthesis radical SAM protein ArsS [Bdellovibrionales bacterium]|nr:arsenosugar biosynthesis radical SAM protein ArsS [Bdellovibrionales bacterium]